MDETEAPVQGRISRLENRLEKIETDLGEIKELIATLKGGWKALAILGSIVTAVAGILVIIFKG